LARAVVANFEASGACREGQISLDGASPVNGKWDALRIEQVVTNLVSNAIKYGAGKPIAVRVTGEAGRARIDITDHGIGIDPAVVARIFEPFQRAPSVRHIQGLGLGLFVVRSIIESHGGKIAVESSNGEGSRFSVELPIGPSRGPSDESGRRS